MLIAILKSIWIPLIIVAVICGILGCIAGYVSTKIKHLEKELKHANEFFGEELKKIPKNIKRSGTKSNKVKRDQILDDFLKEKNQKC